MKTITTLAGFFLFKNSDSKSEQKMRKCRLNKARPTTFCSSFDSCERASRKSPLTGSAFSRSVDNYVRLHTQISTRSITEGIRGRTARTGLVRSFKDAFRTERNHVSPKLKSNAKCWNVNADGRNSSKCFCVDEMENTTRINARGGKTNKNKTKLIKRKQQRNSLS